MAISRYSRYPVSGMTNVQIYTGTVSIQYRDTTTYQYTTHPYTIIIFAKHTYLQMYSICRICENYWLQTFCDVRYDVCLALPFWATWKAKQSDLCPSFLTIQGWKPQSKFIFVQCCRFYADLAVCDLRSTASSPSYSLSGGRQLGQCVCDLAVKLEGTRVWRCLEPGT